MFNILRRSFAVGIATTQYPQSTPELAPNARGCPEIDFANWKDARPAARICPTRAIDYQDEQGSRTAWLDLSKCIFCGLCAEVDSTIRMTTRCELAATQKSDLCHSATYALDQDGTHQATAATAAVQRQPGANSVTAKGGGLEIVGGDLQKRIRQMFGRSLHIREVDAGSCNGCEIEIVGLNSPIYDLERFGIHFVASPRHADMLLVTGPVSRNMELALRKTYDAMPAPRLVVAVGACACSGGIFGRNYATCGGVDGVVPVDAYIPGCPPNPFALLHGILVAIRRLETPSR